MALHPLFQQTWKSPQWSTRPNHPTWDDWEPETETMVTWGFQLQIDTVRLSDCVYMAMVQNDQPPIAGWQNPTKHDQKSVGHYHNFEPDPSVGHAQFPRVSPGFPGHVPGWVEICRHATIPAEATPATKHCGRHVALAVLAWSVRDPRG